MDAFRNTHVKLLAFDFLSLTQHPADPNTFRRKSTLLLTRAENVGVVVTRELKPDRFLRFTVDDGTGCIPCILWLNQLNSNYFSRRNPSDVRLIAQLSSRFASQIQLGVVARVRGRISSYRGSVQITVSDVVVERDPNVEILHLVQCIKLARVLHQLAVEFDTYKNEFDPDANHIAIDAKSIEDPVAVKSLNTSGIYLTSGREIAVKIEYDGWSKNLQIYVSYFGQPLMSFLNHTLKLKGTVPSSIYVGFTAATGTLCETHQVLAWDFESTELPKASLGREKKVVVMIAFPVIALFLILSLLASPFVVGMRRRRRERAAKEKEISLLIAAANGPKLFSYKKLSKATGKFSKDNLLGSGGFGSVYKGIMSNPPSTIAVKKISSTSKQGEKEYLAEICTIGRLTHKNLLQLQGWCHDRDQLLLVYNYMPNGSLDRFIGKRSPFLIWQTRYKILQGLASALLYLHEECGTPVVHRDVKPNNVMLDSNYHVHLGDFGLARLLPEEAAVTTMIAGTLGYLAPEVSFTGRATTESDVYSFGVVVLEVVCGRRTKGIMEENGLVDGAWNLYEQGKLLECGDKLLEGKFDEEEVRRTLVVGLACLNPDYTNRPTTRKVVQVFMNRDEPLMSLPRCRPMAVSLSFNSAASSRSSDFGSGIIVNGGGGSTMSSSSQDGSRVPI